MIFGYVIRYVPDVTAAVEFYERAFALQRRFVHESGYGEMETGGTALGFATEALAASHGLHFQPSRRDAPQAPPVEIAFVVDDPWAAFARAVDAGATPVLEPTRKPWGQTVAYVRDLNGFLVELCTAVDGP